MYHIDNREVCGKNVCLIEQKLMKNGRVIADIRDGVAVSELLRTLEKYEECTACKECTVTKDDDTDIARGSAGYGSTN